MIGDRYITSPLMSYVRCRGSIRQALDIAHSRLIFAASTLSLLFLCIVLRLFDIALFQGGESYALELHKKGDLQTSRANIVDRRGNLLATTVATGSLYANTQVIENPSLVAQKLHRILSLDSKKLLKLLSSNRRFIWIERHLTPKQQTAIIQLGIPGLDIMRDERRIYPHGEMTSHIVGMVDIDNQGISGIEKSLDGQICTSTEDIRLSIDLNLQNILFQELQKGMEEFRARAVNGLIMDIKTGEILSMISLPSFNPNIPRDVNYKNLFDRNVSGVYELGSILKIINTALFLETTKSSLQKTYDATKPLKVGRFRVTDYHGKYRWMTISDIFRYSSNIGSGLMALEAGIDAQKSFLKKIGLMNAPSIELPGKGKPLYPRHWSEANAITISYGYGISTTPLQFASIVASLINNGLQITPTLLYSSTKKQSLSKRLVSSRTSGQLRALMRLTTTQGTSRKANLSGYVVIGKTGTAMQTINGKYREGILTTSFVGSLGRRLNEPEYLILVTYDRPKETKETHGFRGAGWNAAPTARKIMERMVAVLGLSPVISKDTKLNHDIKTLVRLAKFEA